MVYNTVFTFYQNLYKYMSSLFINNVLFTVIQYITFTAFKSATNDKLYNRGRASEMGLGYFL